MKRKSISIEKQVSKEHYGRSFKVPCPPILGFVRQYLPLYFRVHGRATWAQLLISKIAP